MATRARTEVPARDLTATTSGYRFTNSSLSYLNSLAQPGRTEIHGIGSFTDRYAPVTGISNGTITMAQPSWNKQHVRLRHSDEPLPGRPPLHRERLRVPRHGRRVVPRHSYRHPVLQAAHRAGHE
ncbi:hypothetical protein GCM10011428_78890 [Streptomyces violaceus]